MKQLHKWKDIKAAGRSAERVRQLEQEALDELRDMDLRAIREAAGLTQEELAAKVDISQSHLSRMEGGELGSLPTLSAVQRSGRQPLPLEPLEQLGLVSLAPAFDHDRELGRRRIGCGALGQFLLRRVGLPVEVGL
jgi:DNA-binding XRE family transcriptional regulator